MKMNHLSFCVLGLAITFCSAPPNFGQPASTDFKQWEYYFASCDEKELNQVGQRGWEAVGMSHHEGECKSVLLKRIKGVVPKGPETPPSSPPKCDLSLKDAPNIRGLKLGMKLDALYQAFPLLKENLVLKNALANGSKPPNVGISSFHLSSHNRAEFPEQFVGLNYVEFVFLDDELVSYGLTYPIDQGSYLWEQQTWLEKVIDAYKLPGQALWEGFQTGGPATLKCKEFIIKTHHQSPSILVSNNSFQNISNQRRLDRAKQNRDAFKP